MERLRGSEKTTIDDKGRFKVPAIFRAPIEAEYGADFFVTSLSGAEVLVFPMPVWSGIEERLAALPAVHRVKAKFLDRYNTFGQVVRMDGQGRLLIPSLLRDTSKLEGDALVLGQTDHLKLVDRDRHVKGLLSEPITDEDYDELTRQLS